MPFKKQIKLKTAVLLPFVIIFSVTFGVIAFVQKANYFQIQNVQLGYTFDKLFGHFKTRVYLSASQPLSIYSYEGFNPEIASGLDTETYPMAATYSIGASITF